MSRLDELLARNLGVSKTAVVRLLAAGRVTDEAGQLLGDRKQAIAPAEPPQAVRVDGELILLHERALVLLHKPVGVVTALRDARHPTAYSLLEQAPLFPELRPVGRLDLDTSGLLLWTTEGALLQRLTHPKRRVPRTYHAALACPFAAPQPEFTLEDGHRPEIVELAPLARGEVHPALALSADAPALATITVVGGAYHEVRRIFAALGSHVLALCRTAFGPYALPPELPPKAWQRLECPEP